MQGITKFVISPKYVGANFQTKDDIFPLYKFNEQPNVSLIATKSCKEETKFSLVHIISVQRATENVIFSIISMRGTKESVNSSTHVSALNYLMCHCFPILSLKVTTKIVIIPHHIF